MITRLAEACRLQEPCACGGVAAADPPTCYGRVRLSSRGCPLQTRFRYSFSKTCKPVLDDAPYRSFDMEEYRRWCDENLAKWLGDGRT